LDVSIRRFAGHPGVTHVPITFIDLHDGCLGEVGLIKIDQTSITYIDSTIPRVNVNLFSELSILQLNPFRSTLFPTGGGVAALPKEGCLR
jgi:hypothetical protein